MQGTLKLCRFEEADKPLFLLNQMEGRLLSVFSRENRMYTVGRFKKMNFDTEKNRFFLVKHGNFPVAAITLQNLDFENTHCQLSMNVFDENILQNIGGDIVALALKYCFFQIDLHKVYGFVSAQEQALVDLLLAQGFSIEGTLTDTYFDQGQYQDQHVMGLLRKEYLARGGDVPWEVTNSYFAI